MIKRALVMASAAFVLAGLATENGSAKGARGNSITHGAASRQFKVGQCEVSSIIWIHRGPMRAPGVYFRLANGVVGSAYIPEPAALRSSEGDSVRTCLLYPPSPRCEGHDPTQIVSGRTFRTTNLRTHESWDASEYNRMCSG